MANSYNFYVPGGKNINYSSSTIVKMNVQPPVTYQRILTNLVKNNWLEKIKFWLISRKWLDYSLEIKFCQPVELEKFLKSDGVDYTRIDIGDFPICYICFTKEAVGHMRIIQ